jgi:hypothetical protein
VAGDEPEREPLPARREGGDDDGYYRHGRHERERTAAGALAWGQSAAPGDPKSTVASDDEGKRDDAVARPLVDVGVGLPRAGFSDVDVHFDARWELPVAYVAGRRRDAHLRSRRPECGGKLFS